MESTNNDRIKITPKDLFVGAMVLMTMVEMAMSKGRCGFMFSLWILYGIYRILMTIINAMIDAEQAKG